MDSKENKITIKLLLIKFLYLKLSIIKNLLEINSNINGNKIFIKKNKKFLDVSYF